MIYELRTYDLKPRSLPEVEKRFGEAYEKRKKYSELALYDVGYHISIRRQSRFSGFVATL